MKHFMIICPGWTYAGDFYGDTKREAVAACRKNLGVSRMPIGYKIWEA